VDSCHAIHPARTIRLIAGLQPNWSQRLPNYSFGFSAAASGVAAGVSGFSAGVSGLSAGISPAAFSAGFSAGIWAAGVTGAGAGFGVGAGAQPIATKAKANVANFFISEPSSYLSLTTFRAEHLPRNRMDPQGQ
jgi:hypothetical protein